MSIDPITTEVVINRLRETAATMEHALYHSGYSTILRESQDGTAGITDAQGRVIVVSGGLQYHSLPYTNAVRSVIARFGDSLRPDDSFVLNDPYSAGNPHVPDVVVVTPIFFTGQLIAFAVSLAHKADLGGMVPGSSGAAAREIYHDGLLLPPVRYRSAEGVNEAVEDILRSNSRVPDAVVGDLRGQVGCTRLGAERLAALCEEYGTVTLTGIMNSLLETTAGRLAAELASWPDGSAESEGLLDHDGADLETPVRIHVRATKTGDRLTLDFSGCSPQTLGPVNCCMPTAQAVCLLAAIAVSDPTIPINSGLLERIDFVIPEGRVLSPQHPATVNHYFPTAHLIYSVVLAALGQLNPGRAVAPSGLGTGALAVGYPQSRLGKRAVQYELLVTSLGGTSREDGAAVVLAINHFTPSTPVEVLETEYPVRVRCFDIWRDSAGPGEHRGGTGFVREYEFLSDCVVTARTSNHTYGAWGLQGGGPPRPSQTILNPGMPAQEELGPLVTRVAEAGHVLRMQQSGGAGYGNPLRRPLERVMGDLADGYISAATAAEDYGVVLRPDSGDVDTAATEAARADPAAAS